MKARREDRWTQMHLEYRDAAEYYRTFAQSRMFDWVSSHRESFEKLAAAYLTFRDAAWAADLYP
jgi:hypothetical protein